MSADGSDLLRRLGSGVLPPGVDRGANGPGGVSGASAGGGVARTGQLDEAGFAQLLQRARAGELSSGRPVTIDRGVGATLDAEQLGRLGRAVDRAEAQGLNFALVLLDGQGYVVDVATRRVTGTLAQQEGVASGVDGVVQAAPAPRPDGESPAAESAAGGAALIDRRTLLGRLGGVGHVPSPGRGAG